MRFSLTSVGRLQGSLLRAQFSVNAESHFDISGVSVSTPQAPPVVCSDKLMNDLPKLYHTKLVFLKLAFFHRLDCGDSRKPLLPLGFWNVPLVARSFVVFLT